MELHCRDGSLQRTGLARYTLVWGNLHKSEIDFVVERDGRRCYVQVAYVMASESTIDREFGALEAIGDSYPKYVVSMDPVVASRNGITHVRLIDFLRDESLLRLG